MLASPDCPRCGAALDLDRSRADLKPRVCAKGHGAFLTAEQAARVFGEEALAPLRQAVAGSPFGDVACLACGKAMRAFPLAVAGPTPGVVEIDGCGACGTFWFDAGELARAGGPDLAPRPAPRRPEPRPARDDPEPPRGRDRADWADVVSRLLWPWWWP